MLFNERKFSKLEDFIEKKKDSISPEILKSVIDVCLETQNEQLAEKIAKSKEMYEDYLQVLIIRQKKNTRGIKFYISRSRKRKKTIKIEN